MSEGTKWGLDLTVQAAWKWVPVFMLDTESNYIISRTEWLCFGISGSWRK